MKQRLLSLLLLFALALTALFGMSGCKEPEEELFDYKTEDLSPYITVDTTKYKDVTMDLKYDAVTEADVDDWICRILFSHRSETPLNDGAGETDAPITLGDEVYVYYRGYTLDADGERTYIDRGTNTAAEAEKISIGKMSHVSGFETSLIGLVPRDMTTLKNSGRVALGDYVTVSYFVLYPDKTYERTTATFLLSEDEKARIDARFGEGFYDTVVSEENALEYGTKSEHAYISSAQYPYTSDEHGTGTVMYQDMVFLYGTSAAEPAVVAETYFPASHEVEILQCKTVYFDIYLDAAQAYAVQYDTPTLDETFILEQEEISMEDILAHEGDTIVEQYRSVVRELLQGSEEERQMSYETVLYDAVFELLVAATTVNEYPAQALTDVKEPLRAELEHAFSTDGATYGYTDKEVFAKAYFGYTSGTFEQYADKTAKETVHRRMAYYGIARQEGVLPTEAQIATKSEALKQLYFSINLENNKDDFDRDKFDSDEAYQKALDEYFEEMLDYYTEDFFTEEAEYLLVMERLSQNIRVNVLGRAD